MQPTQGARFIGLSIMMIRRRWMGQLLRSLGRVIILPSLDEMGTGIRVLRQGVAWIRHYMNERY